MSSTREEAHPSSKGFPVTVISVARSRLSVQRIHPICALLFTLTQVSHLSRSVQTPPNLIASSLLISNSNQDILNNHLRNPLSAQRLTRGKLLLLQPRQSVERSSDKQHDRRRDQARGVADQRQPLHHAHDGVDGGAHIVGLEAADEGVEFLGRRADAQQERDFDED